MATVMVDLTAEASQLDDLATDLADLAAKIDEQAEVTGRRFPDLDQATAAVIQVRDLAAQLTAWADKITAELGKPIAPPSHEPSPNLCGHCSAVTPSARAICNERLSAYQAKILVATLPLASELWDLFYDHAPLDRTYRGRTVDAAHTLIYARLQAVVA